FRVVNGEWEYLRIIQQFQCGHGDFDLAGRNLRVVSACGTLANFAGDADHAFAAQRTGLVEELFGKVRGIKYRLRAAFAVADIDKNQPTQIATRMDPTAKGDGLPDICRAELIAMMRPFHDSDAAQAQFGANAERLQWIAQPPNSKGKLPGGCCGA